jgi:F-type H+-transporting ATPase subunit b
MRKLTLWMALLCGLAAAPVWAQQHEPASERAEEGASAVTEGEGGLQLWAWANFILLAAGLTYVFRKNAIPFFNQRSVGIRKGMMEADQARAAAEQRIADVEARLAKLETDIQALKAAALAEEKSEHERVRQETVAELRKIRVHTEREIISAGKTARAELKRYAGSLAVSAAVDKIRARVNPSTQDALVREFVHDLTGGPR